MAPLRAPRHLTVHEWGSWCEMKLDRARLYRKLARYGSPSE